jgi:hypothetical protein
MEPVRDANMIQIFFSHFSSNEEITALLDVRIKEIKEHLHLLKTSVQTGLDENAKRIGVERARQLWQITLDYGIAHFEFELDWYEKTRKNIENLAPLMPPKQ